MLQKYIEEKICPICLSKGTNVNRITTNNPFVLDVVCLNCTKFNIGDFAVGKIQDLTKEQREWISEKVKQKVEKGEKVVINGNNYEKFLNQGDRFNF